VERTPPKCRLSLSVTDPLGRLEEMKLPRASKYVVAPGVTLNREGELRAHATYSPSPK